MPSRGSGLAVAVARTTVSPIRTTTDPWACLAHFPVSNESCLPPERSTATSCFMSNSFWAGGRRGPWLLAIGFWLRLRAGSTHADRTDASNDGRPRGPFRTAFHWKPNARDLYRRRSQQNDGRAIPI